MKSLSVFALVLSAATMFGQNVSQVATGNNSSNINQVNGNVTTAPAATPPVTHEITVKSSPAEDALMEMSSQNEGATKAYMDLLQQARTNLDALNKPILDEMKSRSAKWQAKIDAENKDLKAKLDKNNADAVDRFKRETAGLQAHSVSPQTISALVEVVKKEQNLPNDVIFDSAKKVWTAPGPAPVEVKK